MRYAIISDIHANWQAWEAVLKDIEQAGVDGVICLGDIVGYGPQPAKVLESVYEASDVFVLGNHDAVICGRFDSECFNDEAKVLIDWTADQLNDSAVDFFNQVPMVVLADDFGCSHSEFAIPERFDYIYDPHEAVESLEATEEPLLFVGHTHFPGTIRSSADGKMDYFKPQDFSLQQEARYLVNVGSVGDPRNGDIRASYCIYDLEKNAVEFRNVPFDIEAFREQIVKAGISSKPILFDYAGKPIEDEAPKEKLRIRDFHVDEAVAKAAAAGSAGVERISDTSIHNRRKIQVSAGVVGGGSSFRSVQAAQQRAAQEAKAKRKKLQTTIILSNTLLVIFALSAYFLFFRPDGSIEDDVVKSDPIDQSMVTATNGAAANRLASETDPSAVTNEATAAMAEINKPLPAIEHSIDLIDENAAMWAFVPTEDIGTAWRLPEPPENADAWVGGADKNGVGYDSRNKVYHPLIKLDTSDDMAEGALSSCYVRMPFTLPAEITSTDQIPGLVLSLAFDDGFVAFLNGTRIAAANEPVDLTWNADATGKHAANIKPPFDQFDVSAYLDQLRIGETNMLAIHALNDNVPGKSSDLLIVARLKAASEYDPDLLRLRGAPAPAAPAGPTVDKLMAELKTKTNPLVAVGKWTEAAKLVEGYSGTLKVESENKRKQLAKELRGALDTAATRSMERSMDLLQREGYGDAFKNFEADAKKYADFAGHRQLQEFKKDMYAAKQGHQHVIHKFAKKGGEVDIAALGRAVSDARKKRGEGGKGEPAEIGTQIIYGIKLSKTKDPRMFNLAPKYLEDTNTLLGKKLVVRLNKANNERNEKAATDTIAKLKTRMGVTDPKTKDPKVMLRGIHKTLPDRNQVNQYQQWAKSVASSHGNTKAFAAEKPFFDLIPDLQPLSHITPDLRGLTGYYRLTESSFNAKKKGFIGSKGDHPVLQVTASKRTFKPTPFGNLFYFDGAKGETGSYLTPQPLAKLVKRKAHEFTLVFWSCPHKPVADVGHMFTLGKRDESNHALRIGYTKDYKRVLLVPKDQKRQSSKPAKYGEWAFNIITYQKGTVTWYTDDGKPLVLDLPEMLQLEQECLIGMGREANNTRNGAYKGFLTEIQFYDRAFHETLDVDKFMRLVR